VILDILFKNPVWSLARGDAFEKPFFQRLLFKLKMLPVYRTSEGVGNLENNYTTFDACRKIFKEKGIVLMFSEGRCLNEWHLRPLKKGTARLAFGSWEEGIDLHVLPVGINYSSFRRFGKNIFINFGEVITKEMFSDKTDGKKFNSFNDMLGASLQACVFEIGKEDRKAQEKLIIQTPAVIKFLLFIPAVFGWIGHAPLYFPLKLVTVTTLKDTEFYDGILTGLVVLCYPIYLLLIWMLFFLLTGSWLSLLVFIILPVTAWCFIRVKGQLDRIPVYKS
jgi:hypothetical protein